MMLARGQGRCFLAWKLIILCVEVTLMLHKSDGSQGPGDNNCVNENNCSHITGSERSNLANFQSFDDNSSGIVSIKETVFETPEFFIPVLYYIPDYTQTAEEVIRDVTDYACGKESFCNASLSEHTGLCTFECHPCQCDDECHYFGDCCGDLIRDPPLSPSLPFPYLTCSLDTWTKWENSTNVFMVSLCPEDSSSQLTKKCTTPDIVIQDEATPVSLPNSSVTYRNIHCAMCHGVTDFRKWRHEVTCIPGSSIQTAKSRAELWRLVVGDSGCSIVTKPPPSVSIRDCYPTQHDTCNVTGKWSSREPAVEALCRMYSHPVDFYGNTPFYKTYRNSFCALCNGAMLDLYFIECERVKSPVVPYPLNVLLDFNPDEAAISSEDTACGLGEAYDPFSMSCLPVNCPARRTVVGNECEEIFSAATGLGLAFEVTMAPKDNFSSLDEIQAEEFQLQYFTKLNVSLGDFMPFVFSRVVLGFYANKEVHLHAEIVSMSMRSLFDLESSLLRFSFENFMFYPSVSENITFSSTPMLCPRHHSVRTKYPKLPDLVIKEQTPLSSLHPSCSKRNCAANIIFETVSVVCPFLRYNLTQSIFTLESNNSYSSLNFNGHTVNLSPLQYVLCGGILRICVQEVDRITGMLVRNETQLGPSDLTLSIVSLVSQTLSLVGLALTFLTYSLLPKLRTLPGKNTMALVFHLFLAQLLFLSASGSTDNAALCQVFGGLIHYFWLSSFAWMSVSAYHMHSVFTSIHSHLSSSNSDTRRLVGYAALCVLLPSGVIAVCLSVYLTQTQGANSGYGGRVCFLNSPTAIGCFFAAPLVIMLVFNGVLFTKTILAIRSVPDIKASSNAANTHHILVYVKLSLLFGFTWAFGIVAEVVRSDVLSYVFVVLTGSQGVMLFVAYCLKKRTWTLLKEKFARVENTSAFNSTTASFYTSNVAQTGTANLRPKQLERSAGAKNHV